MNNHQKKFKIKDFWNLFRAFTPSKWLIVLSVTLVLVGACFSLIIPLITMRFVNGMDFSKLNGKIIIFLIIFFILQLTISSISLYTMSYISQYIVLGLRKKIWEKVLYLPVSYFDQHTAGEIMSRITNDTLVIKDFITSELISFISGIISIIGSIVFLFIIDWKMTLLMSIAVPLTIICISPLGKKAYKVSKSLQDETAGFQSDLGRVLSDVRLVKSSLAEKQEKEVGFNRMNALFLFGLQEGKIIAFIQPFTTTIMLLLLVVIFGYGSLRVAQGSLTAGALVAIIFYLFQIVTPCSQLASFFTKLQKFLGASERLNYILLMKSEEREALDCSLNKDNLSISDNTLSFLNVSFGYSENKTILQSICFHAVIGQITAIVGLSGVGKTTLFSLIERFYEPQEGKINYNGKAIHNISLHKWRNKIAYVLQDSPIMYGTILSNLTYGMENCSEDQIKEAIRNANLEKFIESLPMKYNTEVGERGVKLSGGQRQRLAIAHAMIRDPKILLLDEATAHLDSFSEKLVQESLERLMKGRTTLVIAHRLATIKNADQIVILENGIVTGTGSHKQLLETHTFYKELVGRQEPVNKYAVEY